MHAQPGATLNATMRAMILDQQKSVTERPLELREVDAPVPGETELRLKVSHCGICHTDLHTIEGELPSPKLPLIPGHQIVGVVDAVGSRAFRVKPGDRVGIPWLQWTDGICSYCRGGMENLCTRARFTGYDVNGGYAEYTIVDEHYVCRLPANFTDEHAAPLLCAGVIGFRSYNLSNVPKDGRLGLYGFGASAHIVLQIARHLGREVWVFTRTPQHKELALKLGAAWVGDADEDVSGKLDSAIIFAPSSSLVPYALRALRKGGTVTLAGIHMSPIPQLDYRLLCDERVLRSVSNATRQDAQDFLEIAAAMPVRTEVTVFPLESANDALIALKESRFEGAGVLKI
jgi:propanol-preferring alcohol dehydrogenase